MHFSPFQIGKSQKFLQPWWMSRCIFYQWAMMGKSINGTRNIKTCDLESRSRSYENEVWEGWNFGVIFGKAGKAGNRSPILVKIVQKGWKIITNYPKFGCFFVLTAVGTLLSKSAFFSSSVGVKAVPSDFLKMSLKSSSICCVYSVNFVSVPPGSVFRVPYYTKNWMKNLVSIFRKIVYVKIWVSIFRKLGL